MKILIIDDNALKQREAIEVLKENSLTDYEIANCIREYYIKTSRNEFDLIILDLGLPRFTGDFISSSTSGLSLLYDCIYRKNQTPIIIYSSTKIPSHNLEYISQPDSPYLGQAKDISDLNTFVKAFLKSYESRAKVLVIDGIPSSQNNAIGILNQTGITDCDVTDNTLDAMTKIYTHQYDILILGTLFPNCKNNRFASPEEGKEFLLNLSTRENLIPTIVYSECFFPEDIYRFKQKGYPIIGQASDPIVLKQLLEKHLETKENQSFARVRNNPNK